MSDVTRVAILDDYAGLARTLPCWDGLRGRVSVESFGDTLADEAALAARLAPYPVVVGIRERTRFTASLLARLPALRLLALAGRHSGQVDVAAASAAGVLVTDTDGTAPPAVEHTIGLILAVVRRIPQDDRAAPAAGRRRWARSWRARRSVSSGWARSAPASPPSARSWACAWWRRGSR
jgi:lactate dehydrogenase-like 2-hydroxyacid dehydrogenase